MYYHFSIWIDCGILDEVLKLVGSIHISNGRKESTTFLIIDSQSVKNTDAAKQKSYDVGKKVSGIKRHIAVYTQGFSDTIHITTTDFIDRNGATEMIK